MKLLEVPILITYDQDTYIAKCPLIQGAFAEGNSPEESLKELITVIRIIIKYHKERKINQKIKYEI